MTADRKRLPNRRAAELLDFECSGFRFTATVSRFADGRLAEVFIDAAKSGSGLDALARDGAILVSLLLQHGVELANIRHSITRNPNGSAGSPLGRLLDLLAEEP